MCDDDDDDDNGVAEDVSVYELELRFDSGGCAHGRRAATSLAVALGVGETHGAGCWRPINGYVTVSRSLHGRPGAGCLDGDGDGGDTSPRPPPNASDCTPSRRAAAQYGAAHAFVPMRSNIVEPLPNWRSSDNSDDGPPPAASGERYCDSRLDLVDRSSG